MPQQAFAQTEKEALKEFRLALKSGEVESTIAQHSDETLLRLLRYRNNHWRRILYGIATVLLLIIVTAIGTWLTGTLLFVGSFFTFTIANQSEAKRKSAKTWATIGKRIEAASLPTLLEAYGLSIPDLSSAIRTGMIKQLTLATHEDLLTLTPWQRHQLVRFTLGQLHSFWGAYPMVNASQRQAATLGYLALATLRQPGAERPDTSGINATHVNLKKAIADYRAALSVSRY
ncbi:MAG: hypothetical protein QM758_27465 [Armatimonas sp.]